MCSQGPHKNEKLYKHVQFTFHEQLDFLMTTDLPRLHRLPRVKSAANLRDLTRIIGDKASACNKSIIHTHFKIYRQTTESHQTKAEKTQQQTSKEANDSLLLALTCTVATEEMY